MIDIMFEFVGDYILVRINGNNITFGNTAYGNQMASIDGLKLSQEGAIKEFPDLKDRSDWREEAIKRFKEKITLMSSEPEIEAYIISDLRKYGYKPLYKQRQGFRKIKL